MDWHERWRIILGILTSVGGISGIILAAIKFSSNIIAKRLEEKYTLKLNKELERYKSSLDNKIYISKTKFDTEFSIYRELSKVFFKMVKDINIMIPFGDTKVQPKEADRKENEKQTHFDATNSVVLAQDVLNCNAPFIPYDIFEKFDEILAICKIQLNVFEQRWNVFCLTSQAEKEKIGFEDYKRTNEINIKFKALNSNIREYLSKLDVLD